MQKDPFHKIHTAKIKFYLRCMKLFGFSEHQVLSGTQYSKGQLDDPFCFIDIPSSLKIINNMISLSKMPDLAFRMGDELKIGDLGVFGYAVSACDNLAVSHPVWHKHLNFYFGNLITMHELPCVKKNCQLFEYRLMVKLPDHLEQFLMEERINFATRLFHRFIGIKPMTNLMTLTYHKPGYHKRYDELLGTSTQFSAERNLCEMNLDASHLNEAFQGADKETLNLCMGYLDKLQNSLTCNDDYSERTRRFIKESLPKIPTLTEAAEIIGLTERTFSRRLEVENTTYKQLVNDVRKEMVFNYASSTILSINDISSLLGFSNAASLCRAFKNWTGLSISQYKQSQLN